VFTKIFDVGRRLRIDALVYSFKRSLVDQGEYKQFKPSSGAIEWDAGTIDIVIILI